MESNKPTPDSIKRLVLQLLRPKNRHELRRADDRVVFVHSLGTFRGRDAYYSALRVATALWTYESVEFVDAFVADEVKAPPIIVKAALVTVLSIRPRLPRFVAFAVPLLDFPTIAVLHFERRCGGSSGDGGSDKYLLTSHLDSNSILALLTAFLPLHVPWRVAKRAVLPLLGLCGVLVARALDAVADALDARRAAAGSWLRPLLLLMDSMTSEERAH